MLVALAPPPPQDAAKSVEVAPPPVPGVPAGFTIRVFAREPLVADPVAIAIDEKGRVYSAESERQERGVEDNRSSKFWLMDDLAAQTIEDRLAYYEKWKAERKGEMDYYRAFADRLRRIEDTDGDGVGDRVTKFSRDFREPLDGTGAGVLIDGSDIYYACIPSLWRFRDANGDGVADSTDAVFTGFGVRSALRGHDMHGLIVGPDGRIYWSIGDRGYKVVTKEGVTLADPKSGAVFRCRPDGSELELFATGLRNPQELAFNEFGDLFTGDNNSDGGDKARFVHVMEGGETGWDMNYQTLEKKNQRGPWNREGIWHLRTRAERDYPAWTLPPLAHVGSGPSGLAYAPGTGLPAQWDRRFYMCDFLGSETHSNVLAIATQPKGASYEVTAVDPFVTEVLTTDVAFGPDSRMYVSAWGGGWYSTDKGTIYAVSNADTSASPDAASAREILAKGCAHRPQRELLGLLHHADMRVRQAAQFALVAMGSQSTKALSSLAASTDVGVADERLAQLARIHAIRALGMQASGIRGPVVVEPDPLAGVLGLLDAEDAEIRVQAARVLGDSRTQTAIPKLTEHVLDESVRVRAECALALGRIGLLYPGAAVEAIPMLNAALWENEDHDAFLRHALVVGLADCADGAMLAQLSADEFPSVRLGVLLAMRRHKDPAIQRFLFDPDMRLAAEAARAIWDVPIPEAFEALAAASGRLIPLSTGDETAPAPTYRFTREVWKGKTAPSSAALESALAFATKPNEQEEVASATGFSAHGDNYLQRLSGTIVPESDGDYTFYLTSDDHSVLFLEESGDPTSRRTIARVDGYTEPTSWEGEASQVSEPIALKAGTTYRLEARHSQGGGGNHLAIGWRHADGTLERPIGLNEVDPSLAAFARRTIAANLMVAKGGAKALAAIASCTRIPTPIRVEALEALGEYLAPPPRDIVHGRVGMVAPTARDAESFASVARLALPAMALDSDAELRTSAVAIATKSGIALDQKANLATALDATRSPEERIAALDQLAFARDAGLAQAVDACLAASDSLPRIAARNYLATLDASRGLAEASSALTSGSEAERQAAIVLLGSLARTGSSAASAPAKERLNVLMSEFERGALAPALRLDLIETAVLVEDPRGLAAAEAMATTGPSSVTDAMAANVLEGGSIAKGGDVAMYNSAVACLRCHAIAGVGGHAGPALDGVGARLTSREILQSIVEPQAVIAVGFATPSAMPTVGPLLTPREIRDLVAYLHALKSPTP